MSLMNATLDLIGLLDSPRIPILSILMARERNHQSICSRPLAHTDAFLVLDRKDSVQDSSITRALWLYLEAMMKEDTVDNR